MEPRSFRSRALRWTSLALGLLLLYWTALWFLQRGMIFPTDAANSRLGSAEAVGAGIPDLERHWLNTDAGRTEYWFQSAPHASAEEPAGLVVFTHGNAELIDGQAWVFAGFRKLGYSVAMCEYRGYGRSEGDPTQADITGDHVAMLEQLLQRPEVDKHKVTYFGRSIGTGVACSLAKELPPARLILISPFRSMASMAADLFVPAWLLLDPFDNEDLIATFDGAVLLLHGTHDTVIPFEHSEALNSLGPHVQLEGFECGHNDFPLHSPRLWQLLGNTM